MSYLKIEDVLDAFQNIQLSKLIFNLADMEDLKLINEINEYNKLVIKESYVKLGVSNLILNINVLLENDYVLNIPYVWNFDSYGEANDSKWRNVGNYCKKIGEKNFAIEVFPEWAIDSDVVGKKFSKENFNSKEFAKELANNSMIFKKIKFKTTHEGFDVYKDEKEKSLLNKNNIDNLKNLVDLTKDEDLIKWKSNINKVMSLVNDLDKFPNISPILRKISKHDLLVNQGSVSFFEQMISSFDKNIGPDTNNITKQNFWLNLCDSDFVGNKYFEENLGEKIDELINLSLEEGVSQEFLLSLRVSSIFRRTFKLCKENGIGFSNEDIDMKEIYSFIEEYDLIDIFEQKDKLFLKLIDVYEDKPFDKKIFEKLMFLGIRSYASEKDQGFIASILYSIFFSKEELDDSAKKSMSDISENLQTLYIKTKEINDPKPLIKYWLSVMYVLGAINKGVAFEDDDMISITSMLKIERETYQILNDLSESKEKFNLDIAIQEIRELKLLEQMDNISNEKEVLKREKKKL